MVSDAGSVEALHRGTHQCAGSWYTDAPDYQGSVAKRKPCPTLVALPGHDRRKQAEARADALEQAADDWIAGHVRANHPERFRVASWLRGRATWERIKGGVL